MHGADALVAFLKAAGVTHSFGVAGESILEVMDAVRGDDAITYVPVRHEQAGALAASGFARTAGRPAVCLGHIGAGASNLVNGMADAYKDDVPVVAITGNDDTVNLGRDVWHEVDHLGMFEPVTEYNARITHPERIPQVLREVMTYLNTGATGPIHIDMPTDIAEAKLDTDTVTEVEAAVNSVPAPDTDHDAVEAPAEAVTDTAARLLRAKRPVILAGDEVMWHDGGPAVESLIEYANVPVLTSLLARGVVSERHEYCFGALGTLGRISAKEVADEVDFVLALGTELRDIETFGWSLFEDAEIVHVLRNEEALGRQYTVDRAVVADPGAFATQLEGELRSETTAKPAAPTPLEDWQATFEEELDSVESPVEANTAPTEPSVVSQYAILEAVAAVKEPADVICSASGKNTLWSSLLAIEEPGTFLKSVGLGTMGFAFPAGIGAQLATPDATTFVLIGDGDFSMVVQELETCVRENLPVVVVVFNDSELSSIKTQQAEHYNERHIGVDYTDVDFATVAEGFGARGVRATTAEAVTNAIDQAVTAARPTVIDVPIDPSVKAPSLFYEVQ